MALGYFEVRGGTWVYWTMRLQANDEHEAAEAARRIGGRVEFPSSCAQLTDRQHFVIDSRELFLEGDAL